MKRVLILGARAPVCLEWAYAFRLSNWSVYVGDSLRFPVSRFGSCVDGYVHLPSPAQQYDSWCQMLHRTVCERNIDLVVPTCEEAFYLALAKATLPCRIAVADFALMQALHHKGSFARLSENWCIGAPETHLLTNQEQLVAYAADSREWVFKPAYSRFACQTLIRPNRASLAKIHPTEHQPWLAQRYVAGTEYCSYSLFDRGKLTASVCYQPRYRAGHGAGIYFTPAEHTAMQAFLVQFGAETGYTGQVGFDFIVGDDGRYWLLECNPRATSGLHLLTGERHNLVAALLGETVLQAASDIISRQISLAMLLYQAPKYLLNLSFWQDFQAAEGVLSRSEHYRLLPAQILSVLELATRAARMKIGLLSAATADIEWNGQVLDKPSA